MSLSFFEIDDPNIPEISVDYFLSECLLVPRGYEYRGQGDKGWDLIPSIFRQPTGSSLNPVERTRRLRYFSGEQFDIDFKRVLELVGRDEKVIISEKQGYKTLLMLALFQHFGLPTPLLDWTSSPLIALFMSLYERPLNADGVSIFRLDPASIPSDVTFQQYNKISFRRIQTQIGGVMFFGTCSETAISVHPHVYKEYISASGNVRFIKKLNIKVDVSDVPKINCALWNNGFREDLIFPNSIQWISKRIRENIFGP